MTVSQLIEKLQQIDPQAEVYEGNSHWGNIFEPHNKLKYLLMYQGNLIVSSNDKFSPTGGWGGLIKKGEAKLI